MKTIKTACAMLACLAMGAAQAAIVTHSTDFIANGTRTHFNGFESIPNNGAFFTGGSGPYTEGGITVQQINGDSGNDIWVTYLPAGTEGAHAWYPNGGDRGYTRIMLSDGSDFADVGFGIGTGGGASLAVFELYDNGSLVLSGSSSMSTHYLGFSGGGFDTIIVRDNHGGGSGVVADGTFQALTIDSIETGGGSVPEPASLALVGLGLLGVAASRKRT